MMGSVRRRRFLISVGLLLGTPLATLAQQAAKVSRIGLVHVGLDHVPPSLGTLREGLRTLGYEEGKNIRLDFRNVASEPAAQAVAQEFVRDGVDLIVAFEVQGMRGVKAVNAQIPVVFLHLSDPVADGFVASLARPGGNVTGFVTFPVSPSKQIELFTEFVPRPQPAAAPRRSGRSRHRPRPERFAQGSCSIAASAHRAGGRE